MNYIDAYTGVGSQETPPDICSNMLSIADEMEAIGFLLRSGHARGADLAFESGVTNPRNMEIYLPWQRFNHAPVGEGYICIDDIEEHILNEAIKIASSAHPTWHNCKPSVRRLHTRNVFQVLGKDLETPSNFVACWTKGGLGKGDTGQAIRIANQHSIPVFDFGNESHKEKFMEYLNIKELSADYY